jgi:16S rRNA (guanine(1405)-N(7))-methyltransferase
MADAPAKDDAAALVAELRASRKYAAICEATLARTAAWALTRTRSRREAAKLARRKLHQVHGAFLPASGLRDAERAAQRLGGGEDVHAVCREVLACHASTRERLPFMEDFLAAAFGDLAGPLRVADLACGLTPFSIPWMPLGAGARYLAIDVDMRMERLVAQLAPHVDVALDARTEDLAGDPPTVEADVALVLKALPTLEHQEAGAGVRLLERIEARRVVVSVSAHSLGGRRRGMRAHHEGQLGELLPERIAAAERHDFASETLYVLHG